MSVPAAARAQLRRVRRLSGRAVFLAARAVDRSPAPPAIAELAYRAAHRLAPRSPAVLFRLGRLRERAKDWRGAEQAYTAGIDLRPPNPAIYLARRAGVRERQGRWHDALADCRALSSHQVPKRLLPRLAEELRCEGRLTDAIQVLERAASETPGAKILAALADCYVELGELATACRLLRAAIDDRPGDLTIRTSLGRVAGRRSLVPFELIDGTIAPAGRPDREAALAEAIGQLEHVVTQSENRVWTAYWLGRLQETHGRLADALESYQTAVARVSNVDQPWGHHALLAWQFRQAYIERQIRGEQSADVRLNRRVAVADESAKVTGTAGFFEASVTNNGLLVEGFVLRGHPHTVDILIDGCPVVSTAGDREGWHHEFKITIVHDVWAEFPGSSVLSVCADGAELCTKGGARRVEVTVPDGSGRLPELLSGGRKITKKGRWSAPEHESRDEAYLAAYAKARDFFDSELGIKLFVSYGTLLGYYRDGRPIEGDDDFDVAYVSEATDPDELKKEGQQIIEALLRGGFDSRVAVDGRMFHLRVDDLVLDVNPFWFYDGRAWSFDAHRLPRAVFEPAGTLAVDGVQLYIPGRAEEFLAENYGPDWRTPKPDFQYHRAKADQRVLRKARLVPSEVLELVRYSEELAATHATAGRFHGYGDPTRPQFG